MGEEEKIQKETKKILSDLSKGTIRPAEFRVSCICTRVNVREGHTKAVFVAMEKHGEPADTIHIMQYYAAAGVTALPSEPKRLIVVNSGPFRPQPILDRDAEGGMVTTVGRIREDTPLENGIKYMLVSHNTKMSEVRGSVLVAEMLISQGYIG